MSKYAQAKSETELALNIVIESASVSDRSFPGVGNGNVSDLKVSVVFVGYDALDANNQSGTNSIDYDLSGTGATTRKTDKTSSITDTQVAGPILLNFGGFIKNNDSNWNTLKGPLKLDKFPNSTLIDLFRKTTSKIQRVFYLNDLNDTESYVSLLLQLITKVN